MTTTTTAESRFEPPGPGTWMVDHTQFRLPAVIGAREACSAIADGDLVEVDPVAWTVRVVEAAPA